MTVCRITVLGSSSGMPSPTRFCSSLFLQTEKLNFLFDCGEGTSFSLLRNKIDPLVIDAVFVSHSHVDHLGGLFLLVQMMYLLERRTTLRVYLPEEAIPGVRDFLNTCYLFPEKLNFRLSLLPMMSGFRFEEAGIVIGTYPNRHLAGNQSVIAELGLPNQMQSFCLVLSLSGKKIVYSSDIASAQDLAPILENADVLITECVHPSLDELFSVVVEKEVKFLLITHIPPELEEKQDQILRRANKEGIERLAFAPDGLSLTL